LYSIYIANTTFTYVHTPTAISTHAQLPQHHLPANIPNLPANIPNLPANIPNLPANIPNLPANIPNLPANIDNFPGDHHTIQESAAERLATIDPNLAGKFHMNPEILAANCRPDEQSAQAMYGPVQQVETLAPNSVQQTNMTREKREHQGRDLAPSTVQQGFSAGNDDSEQPTHATSVNSMNLAETTLQQEHLAGNSSENLAGNI
jgi:hypothetical protein